VGRERGERETTGYERFDAGMARDPLEDAIMDAEVGSLLLLLYYSQA